MRTELCQPRTAWDRMSVDDYAELERASGATLIKSGDVWWRQVRRGFFRPLFPFTRITPGKAVVPANPLLGGYQHLVHDGERSNSFGNLFLFDDLKSYSIEEVGKSLRKDIRKSMRHLEVRPVESIAEFVDQGYPVYLEFFQRTQYAFKSDRTERKYFTEWAEHVFRFPGILSLGVYHEGKLSGLNLSFVIENVIMDATAFVGTEALKLGASDLLWHYMRERAAKTEGVDFMYEGLSTGRQGVDRSKVLRGCKVVAYPAFYKINPVLEIGLRTLRKADYQKLRGLDAQQVEETYYRA